MKKYLVGIIVGSIICVLVSFVIVLGRYQQPVLEIEIKIPFVETSPLIAEAIYFTPARRGCGNNSTTLAFESSDGEIVYKTATWFDSLQKADEEFESILANSKQTLELTFNSKNSKGITINKKAKVSRYSNHSKQHYYIVVWTINSTLYSIRGNSLTHISVLEKQFPDSTGI